MEVGFWIPIVSGIFQDSKPQDFGFHKQQFPGFRRESGFPYKVRDNELNAVY